MLESTPINTGTRVGSMVLDHVIYSAIVMLFFIPLLGDQIVITGSITHDPPSENLLRNGLGYIGLIGPALYLCKDMFNGRSIAKRMLRLQVVDNKTGLAASPLQCLLRNLLLVIWPIEVIVALTNTNRRLGDRLAGTRLDHYDADVEQPRNNGGKILLSLALAYAGLFGLSLLRPLVTSAGVRYKPTSLNSPASAQLSRGLNDSLGQWVQADIRVYDTVINEPYKYVSALIRVKADSLMRRAHFDTLNHRVDRLLYARYPENSITGIVKYFYTGGGELMRREKPLGKARD